jgi:hypothetical protein
MSTLLSLRNFVFGAATPAKSFRTSLWSVWPATVRSALEASAQARAQRELLELADRYSATDPELAKELRAAVGNAS